MLSNLASFLWGELKTPAIVTETCDGVTTEVKIGAVDVDDWVLVEKCIDNEKGDVESDVEYKYWPAVELTMSTVPVILPEPPMEESWFVTPPPCFTSEGPIHMETSPLENLLIEHPSMSVYRHSLLLSEDDEECKERPEEAPSPVPAVVTVVRVRPINHHSLSLQIQQEECNKLKAAQKIRQHKATEAIRRNQLQRNNKAREIDSRNKVRRRSDRMLRHSGANNNRKCC